MPTNDIFPNSESLLIDLEGCNDVFCYDCFNSTLQGGKSRNDVVIRCNINRPGVKFSPFFCNDYQSRKDPKMKVCLVCKKAIVLKDNKWEHKVNCLKHLDHYPIVNSKYYK